MHIGRDGQLHLAVQLVDTRCFRCSGEVYYQAVKQGLMQQLRTLSSDVFAGWQGCSGILPRQIMGFTMLMNSEDWNEDSLFGHRARASRKVCQRGTGGRHEVVSNPDLVVCWKDVCM